MAYKNTKTGEIGTLFKLLPNVSNPTNFTIDELKELNIVKEVPEQKPEPSLEELKERKNQEIKNTLAQLREEGFITSLGFKIDITKEHFDLFKDGKLLLEETGATETEVRDFDNEFHSLTKTEFNDMILEAGVYISNLVKNKWILNKLVTEAQTKEEIQNIYWRKALMDEGNLDITGYEYNPLLN